VTDSFWTDSHGHLAMAEFDADRPEVLARARAAGVRRLVCVGTVPEDWEAVASLAASDPEIRATAGLHPHEASRLAPALLDALRGALDRPGVTAVGEVGLDYHYDLSPRADQLRAFEAQVAVACERDLPLVIHSRLALEDTLAVLRAARPAPRGVLHCFTYGPEAVAPFLDMGFSISLAGIVTFPKAPDLRAAARLIPLERLLVETDAPYLAPVPFRGKRCEPAHVAETGRFLAAALGLEPSRLARATSENAARLFGWEPLSTVDG